jgi:hypothetical protein
VSATDHIALPPERREFPSPDRAFLLVVETENHWKTPYPTARLYRADAAQPVLCWARALTQHHGPRTVLVANDGHVLFVDEWINVASRLALMLVDVDNRVVVTYAFKAIVDTLGVSPRQVAASARGGSWISDGPTLAPDGKSASIAAGGRILAIAFADGRLSAVR